MLNFTKINILVIYVLFFLIGFFSFLNLQNNNNLYIDKKVNLGLDLQGGSYLLLEIDTNPLIKDKIQDKVVPIKKILNSNEISYKNFNINNKIIKFNIEKKNIDKFKNIILNKKLY